MTTRTTRIYEALNQDPELLYEVLRVVHQQRRRTAGPWLQVSKNRHVRRGPSGENVAAINYTSDGNFKWTLSLKGTPINGVTTERLEHGLQPTLPEAQRRADELLKNNAWKIEPKPPPKPTYQPKPGTDEVRSAPQCGDHMYPTDFTLFQDLFQDLKLDQFLDLEWGQPTVTFFGNTNPLPRLTTMYGHAYNYSGVQHPERPMPTSLTTIRDQIEALTGFHANAVLGNLYRDGSDTVGWHSDDDYNATDPRVASVSIGATRRFRIRTKRPKGSTEPRQTWDLNLEHGDLLLMGPQAQELYQHAVPRTSKPIDTRINLTFRSMH